MLGEVISIGDELTSGQRLDTNSQWVSQQLLDLGIQVGFHTTVADDLAANTAVFQVARDRADIVVITGGLGPTADDLTREALAAMLDVPLVLDPVSLTHIESLFARGKRSMPERNRVQAMFPRGSVPIFNPCGTAPGIHAVVTRTLGGMAHFFALPGVPAEMKEMFTATVAPAILGLQDSPRVIRHRRIKCFGVGESHLEAMLPDLIRRGREPSVGITVHDATITLRITASGKTPDECYAAMTPTVATIRESLGELVYGEEDDELEHAVFRALLKSQQTVACCEGGSQGLLAQSLTTGSVTIEGARQLFRGGLVLPMNGPAECEEAAVCQQAEHCRSHFAADYGLAIGPFPESESTSVEANKYFVALATPTGTLHTSGTLSSHPFIWKPRAAKQALNLLRLHLLRG
jgi:nicotinamide-nucleotide amidase